MSKIQAELIKVSDLGTKRGEDRQAFLERVLRAVNDLSDKDFDGLSKGAKEWANTAADAKNSKAKTLPDFPDAEPEEQPEEEKSTRRRSSKEDDKEDAKAGTKKEVGEDDIKDGMPLQIITKRGKDVSGHVVEVNTKKGFVAIKLGNGDEEEFDFDRIDKMYTLAAEEKSSRRSAKDDPDEPKEPGKGDKVKLVTKRGKEYTGKIVELTKSEIVIDTGDGEEEFDRDRVESIELVGSGRSAAKDEPEEKTTRRGAAKADDKEDAGDKKNTRVSNEGVSIGMRIKELIAENLDASADEIAKLLKKEGLEFKENTLKLNYSDMHKTLDILKSRKLLKA